MQISVTFRLARRTVKRGQHNSCSIRARPGRGGTVPVRGRLDGWDVAVIEGVVPILVEPVLIELWQTVFPVRRG
jgi:hypothetical protein